MVVLGVDPHKDSHTVVAVDEVGRAIGEKTVRARTEQHLELLAWARTVAPDERVWAVEDCRHVSGRLERDLLAAGERVVRVPPKLMAYARASARTHGKSDPIDALAVARAALREPGLPVAQLRPDERDVKLLADHREDLVLERTRMQNRLRWHLHDLDPDLDIPSRTLDRQVVLRRLTEQLQATPAESRTTVARQIALELLERISAITVRINQLERQLAPLVARLAGPLMDLTGIGTLTGAIVIGETADVHRFRSEAAFAMHAGVAPLDTSSGRRQRDYRHSRVGNRRLNRALHVIALTQLRYDPDAAAYYQRKISAGSSKRMALRALKRRVARRVFHLLRTIDPAPSSVVAAAA